MKVGYKKRKGRYKNHIPGKQNSLPKIKYTDRYFINVPEEQEIKIPISKEEIEKLKEELNKKGKEN